MSKSERGKRQGRIAHASRPHLRPLSRLAEYGKRARGDSLSRSVAAGGGRIVVVAHGSGKKVFAYLKTFPVLPQLLALLGQAACPTIAPR